MKLTILQCEDFKDAVDIKKYDYPALFKKLFAEAAAPENLEFDVYNVCEGKFPTVSPQLKLVITGSLASAYDETPWIRALKKFIQEAYARGARMAGICFGHQIIAEALGGKVLRGPEAGEGLRFSELKTDFGKKYFPDGRYCIEYSHNDRVFKLPPNAALVSGSDFCAVEAFKMDSRVITFQGHPEFTKEFSDALFQYFIKGTPKHITERRAQNESLRRDSVKVARLILDFFEGKA